MGIKRLLYINTSTCEGVNQETDNILTRSWIVVY